MDGPPPEVVAKALASIQWPSNDNDIRTHERYKRVKALNERIADKSPKWMQLHKPQLKLIMDADPYEADRGLTAEQLTASARYWEHVWTDLTKMTSTPAKRRNIEETQAAVDAAMAAPDAPAAPAAQLALPGQENEFHAELQALLDAVEHVNVRFKAQPDADGPELLPEAERDSYHFRRHRPSATQAANESLPLSDEAALRLAAHDVVDAMLKLGATAQPEKGELRTLSGNTCAEQPHARVSVSNDHELQRFDGADKRSMCINTIFLHALGLANTAHQVLAWGKAGDDTYWRLLASQQALGEDKETGLRLMQTLTTLASLGVRLLGASLQDFRANRQGDVLLCWLPELRVDKLIDNTSSDCIQMIASVVLQDMLALRKKNNLENCSERLLAMAERLVMSMTTTMGTETGKETPYDFTGVCVDSKTTALVKKFQHEVKQGNVAPPSYRESLFFDRLKPLNLATYPFQRLKDLRDYLNAVVRPPPGPFYQYDRTQLWWSRTFTELGWLWGMLEENTVATILKWGQPEEFDRFCQIHKDVQPLPDGLFRTCTGCPYKCYE